MRQFILRYCLAFGSVMSMALVSVLVMAVMMVSTGSAEGATITAKAGTGGKIAPSGTITIKDGTIQQFGIAANSGYTVLSVTGCNGTLSKTSTGFTYKTGRVTGSCNVSASFKLLAPKLSSYKINNDVAETITRSVTLNHTTASGSMPTHYRASEFPNFSGAVFKPYAAAPTFALTNGEGSKTVYLQLKDSSTGNVSNVMSDTIKLLVPQISWFKINNDAAETATRSVTLNHAIAPGPMPTQYRASEFPDFPGILFKPYVAAPTFELTSPGTGSKTVYLQLHSAAGPSDVMSDTINLQLPQLYTIPARDFYAEATSHGFRSTATRLEGLNRCFILTGPGDNLAADQVAARIVDIPNFPNVMTKCSFTFFEGPCRFSD